jgi:Tat protein translocase TatB subunit
VFNIGPPELIVILLVALLIVGPKRLPEVGKSVGRALREIRRQTDEVRSSFEATINVDDDDEPDVHTIEDRTGSDEPVTEWGGEDDPEPAPATSPLEPVGTAAPDPVETRSSRRRRKAAARAADSASADPAPAGPAPDDES